MGNCSRRFKRSASANSHPSDEIIQEYISEKLNPTIYPKEEKTKIWTDCELAEELATFRGKFIKSNSEYALDRKPAYMQPPEARLLEKPKADPMEDLYVNRFVRKIINQTVAGIN